ncbi:MAG: BLUF domain-containing protein [Bacteroidota bacterium]
MYSIIYRSVAESFFGKPQIYKMLSAARENNRKYKITGCLLFHKNKFLQLLEGEKDKVTKLYGRILKDNRHTAIETINEKSIDQPIFSDWSMAFHEFDFGDDDLSKFYKLKELDKIFEKSAIFERPSEIAVDFFKSANAIILNTKN